jgi:hypothetical protein
MTHGTHPDNPGSSPHLKTLKLFSSAKFLFRRHDILGVREHYSAYHNGEGTQKVTISQQSSGIFHSLLLGPLLCSSPLLCQWSSSPICVYLCILTSSFYLFACFTL